MSTLMQCKIIVQGGQYSAQQEAEAEKPINFSFNEKDIADELGDFFESFDQNQIDTIIEENPSILDILRELFESFDQNETHADNNTSEAERDKAIQDEKEQAAKAAEAERDQRALEK